MADGGEDGGGSGTGNDDNGVGSVGLDLGGEADGGAIRGREIVNDAAETGELGLVGAAGGRFDKHAGGNRLGVRAGSLGYAGRRRSGLRLAGGQGLDNQESGL